MAIGRRRRFRNPRGGGGSTVARVLPWLAIGGLLYLMAQNASKVKGATPALPASSAATAGCALPNDFGTTTGCWSCG
jgi:hypothetical protein